MQNKISTGSNDLDKWLEGGYEKGIITLFYGPPASGKSNFVVLTACHKAKEKKVIFIDTEASLSIERVNQISKNQSEEILKNLIILKPTNFQEQKESFMKLNKEIKLSDNIGLVIVDSMAMLYRLELAEARKKNKEEVQNINSDLANQMKTLFEISRKKNIPVIITTQIYTSYLTEEEWLSGKEAGVNVVGGDVMKYWSKCIIELQNKKGKKTAIIRKHRSLPQKIIHFDIINEGIQKKGWMI